MELQDIARVRLRRQRLEGDPFDQPEDVVRWLGAMQSQEFGFAKWSVAQRTAGVVDADVERTFAAGTILRTHVLRPTWHFVAAEDIRWLLALTAPRVHAQNAYHYRRLGLDDGTFDTSNDVLAEALEGGRHLTRPELAVALERAGIAASGVRLAYIVMRGELGAVLCSGPRRGKQQTYALLDERAPGARSMDRDEALAELVTRYFTSRGPATVRDFVWWSGLAAADARRGLEIVGSRLQRQEVDGRMYWFDPTTVTKLGGKTPVLDLVPCYDEIVVSYSETRDILQGSIGVAALDRTGYPHVVLRDGRLIGKWRAITKGPSLIVEVAIHRSVNGEEAGLEEAVERFGRFRGAPATLRIQSAAAVSE